MVANARALKEHMQWTHVGTQCYWPGCATTTNDEGEMRKYLKAAYIVAVEVQAPSFDGKMVTKYRCAWPGCGRVFMHSRSVTQCVYAHAHRRTPPSPPSPDGTIPRTAHHIGGVLRPFDATSGEAGDNIDVDNESEVKSEGASGKSCTPSRASA
ncbi:hypothetical protein F4821DRAFT_255324 [Hypoxylon rubiginosum]|uniref:Uncharacterized protein n=1 Tax=Hypoxylon rubiginosum TaxID=110542 RepID=A0ACC0DE45_9PEZI|nr:hypothetical protein F4821DRAFT_255324 [Hypoxylon rubiginosum]